MPNLAPLLESEKLVMKCMGPKLKLMEALRKEHFTMAVIPKYMNEEKLKYTFNFYL